MNIIVQKFGPDIINSGGYRETQTRVSVCFCLENDKVSMESRFLGDNELHIWSYGMTCPYDMNIIL